MKRSVLKKSNSTAGQTGSYNPKPKWKMAFRPSKLNLFLFVGVFVLSFGLFLFYNFYLNSLLPSSESNHAQESDNVAETPNFMDESKGEGRVEEKDVFAQKISNTAPLPATQMENKVQNPENTEQQESKQEDSEDYHVLLQLVNADKDSKFAKNFYNCIKSILTRTKLNLKFHLTVDSPSIEIAEDVFKRIQKELNLTKSAEVSYYLVDEINKNVYPYTKALQELFSAGPDTYYSHAIFFISTALHKIFPHTIKRLVMLDTDLQFRADIKNLFDLFSKMSPTNIMALANEQQPVYRHVLGSYRNDNLGTLVGEPPPNGKTGYNSGVKLMNMERMRQSNVYNGLLERANVTNLAAKYSFKGHLGDQDFFSLVSFEYPSLFYTLPCQWNRQLCTWWKDNGYEYVFDAYFKCDVPFYVIHGNCNTPITD